MIEDKVAKTAYLSHSHGPKVVGYFSKIEFSPSDPKSKSAAAEFADFQKASRFFSPDVPFRLVTDPKVAKSFGFKSAPSVGVFRPMQHAAILPSSASLSYRSIRAFVEASRELLVPSLTKSPRSGIRNDWETFAVLCVEDALSDDSVERINAVRVTARKTFDTHPQYKFGYADKATNALVIQDMNIREDELPIFVVFIRDGPTYQFPQSTPMNADSVWDFMAQALDGKAPERPARSGDAVESSGPVVQLTYNNFEDVVYHTDAQVVIKFFTPTCPHCLALKPAYDELAVKYADDESVIVAEYDCSVNDLPPRLAQRVRGFPTVLRFDPGLKDPEHTVAAFISERTLAKLVDFVEEGKRVPPPTVTVGEPVMMSIDGTPIEGAPGGFAQP